MDRVFVRDLLVRGVIGIHDWERRDRQDVRINLDLFGDLRQAGETDSIVDCLNYRTAAKLTIAHVESARRLTVEMLATDLAKLLLRIPGVQRVRVRVEKPGAVRFADSVGVEIERTHADFSSLEVSPARED